MFYICKFVFIFFVIYLSKNTSLETAAIGARNMEAYDVYMVTNSHTFISTFWFYSHNTVKLNLKKNIKKIMLASQILFKIPVRDDGRRVPRGSTAARFLKESPTSGCWRFLEMGLATYLYRKLITSKQGTFQFPFTY